MKLLFLVTLPLLCIIQYTDNTLCVNANPIVANQKNKKKTSTRKLQTQSNNGTTIVCADLADFFYEIVLSVTSFPDPGDCSEREEGQIAAFLQDSINAELDALPGTIKTDNKICSNPINTRIRRRRQLTNEDQLNNKKRRMLVRSFHSDSEGNQRRMVLRHGRRSFIYVGGGRCRYCFYDNSDQRALSPAQELSSIQHGVANHAEQQRRHLLFLFDQKKGPFPKVSDISLCHKLSLGVFALSPLKKQAKFLEPSIKWRNAKITSFLRKNSHQSYIDHVGLYRPGESFGIVLDMTNAERLRKKHIQAKAQEKSTPFAKFPVKTGTFQFRLYAYDLPPGFSGTLAHDPLYLFINGIKLDFNLLASQPGTKRLNTRSFEQLSGNSFAGISWRIKRYTRYRDKKMGLYWFEIAAPLVVFSHKNQMDVDIMIKPEAKAKYYAFGKMYVILYAAQCRVTGLENSPFEDFQSVVESRLFHKLGMDLAREFQGKNGHCLHDKIPVVNVHLVEKESPKESNPQCSKHK